MNTTATRRGLLKGTAALTMAAALLAAPAIHAQAGGVDEKAALARLYAEAKQEGGDLVVYMGGDAPGQWDALANAFDAAFPGVKVDLVVDLSKYHDARLDNQHARHALVADMAILQTVQDFDRWRSEGRLLKFVPASAGEIFDNAKDKDGYWTGVFYGGFGAFVNKAALAGAPGLFKASDLLDAKFRDKIILTYPNDDDAVLFGFKLLVDKYGWDWLKGLAAQDPVLVRGVPGSMAGVASGRYLASLATAAGSSDVATGILDNDDPFVSWAQHAAIFREAKHPAAAKLFLSWLTSADAQQAAIATWTWPVRKDVPQPAWLKPLSAYKNTDPAAFHAFMSDRAGAERFRSQLELYFRSVSGPDPASPDRPLGLVPGQKPANAS
jgi:ABC-type Fe3+ transport system substrate-binding protein